MSKEASYIYKSTYLTRRMPLKSTSTPALWYEFSGGQWQLFAVQNSIIVTHSLVIFGGPTKVLRKACKLNVHEKRNLMVLVSVA